MLPQLSKKVWSEFKRKLLPGSRHIELSLISSVDDEPGHPTPRLLQLACSLISVAETCGRLNVSDRDPSRSRLLETWPGEHYKLLKSICQVLKPDLVVEIGTFEGPSALSMLEGMNKSSRLVTFDIVPWKCIPTTWLKTTDFDNGRLAQIVGDLSKPEVFRMHQALFESADLIFIDGPKDIVFETQLLDRLETISLKKDTLVVVDDIRKWNMLKIWKYLARPKLDFTSFGHWSGTGLIDWNG